MIFLGKSNYLKDNKELMKEYDYDKNTDFDLDTLTLGSKKEVWWLCNQGHSYKRSIYYRSRKHGCPVCTKEKVTSFQEKIVFFYIKKYFKDSIDNYRDEKLGKKEIDIFIPTLNVGIEYDGGYYHTNPKSDLEKDILCKKLKIKLYRIRDNKCAVINSTSICYYRQSKSLEELERIIRKLLEDLGVTEADVNISRDLNHIYSQIDFSKKKKSLAIVNPNLSKEWNYEKNGNLTPDKIYSSSSKKVWWKCPNGHEWIGSVNGRSKGSGCPVCMNQIIQEGVNDLETTNPKLVKEWNYEKNGSLKPKEISSGSSKKIWWKCLMGHEWQAAVNTRAAGSGCPYCSNHKVLKGFNDLATTNPEIVKEWNYEKNKMSPYEVSSGSNNKVWWKCAKGHEWEAVIHTRTSGVGCPYCNSNAIKINQYTKDGKFIVQFNSLEEAGKSVGVTGAGIKYACKNKALTKNYQWRFDNNNCHDIEKYVNTNKCIKRVRQYDLGGNYIKTFDGVRQAMKETRAKKISEVCSGKRKTSGGYIWKYERE